MGPWYPARPERRSRPAAGRHPSTQPMSAAAEPPGRPTTRPRAGPPEPPRAPPAAAASAQARIRGSRREPIRRPDAVHQPRAVLARVRRPGPVRGARRPQPAPRADQLPDDLREHARRVLPDPGRPGSASRSTPGRLATSPDGRTAGEQLAAARTRVLELVAEHSAIWVEIRKTLAAAGIEIVKYGAIPEHHAVLRQRFIDEIYPVLTPLAVDPGHPFPYISTLSLSIAVGLRDPETGETPLRPGQGPPDPAPPVRGRAAPVRPPRPDHRGQPRPPVQRDGDRRAPPVPGHPQRRPRDRGGRGGRPPAGDRGGAPAAAVRRGGPARGRALDAGRRRARSSCAASASATRTPTRSRGCSTSPACARSRTSIGRTSRARRGPRSRRPPRPARRGRAGRRPRGDPDRRPPRPPPYESFVASIERFIAPGRRRPRGPDDQADPVPDVGRLADRPRPDPGRRAGQAGRRPRRDQGPLRRGGEHRLGPQAGAGRGPRRLRPRRAEDPLEGLPRRPARGLRAAPLRPHRDRQLQPRGPPGSTRTSGCSAAGPSSAPTSPTCSTS